MKAFKLKDGVFWVGAIDWNPPKFGYSLSKGTTYNSYVILDEKTALIISRWFGFLAAPFMYVAAILPGNPSYLAASNLDILPTCGPKFNKVLDDLINGLFGLSMVIIIRFKI